MLMLLYITAFINNLEAESQTISTFAMISMILSTFAIPYNFLFNINIKFFNDSAQHEIKDMIRCIHAFVNISY